MLFGGDDRGPGGRADHANKQVSLAEWLNAKQIITDRLQVNERALARLSQDDALIGLVGNGSALRAQWETLNVTRQGAIIRAVLEHILIHPATKATGRNLDINPDSSVEGLVFSLRQSVSPRVDLVRAYAQRPAVTSATKARPGGPVVRP